MSKVMCGNIHQVHEQGYVWQYSPRSCVAIFTEVMSKVMCGNVHQGHEQGYVW